MHLGSVRTLVSSRKLQLELTEKRASYRYTFPCEAQALYTQDAPLVTEATFEESTFALHRIELPYGTTMADHLSARADDGTDEASLVFEVFNCFDGGEDDLLAIGALPMSAALHALVSCNDRQGEQVLTSGSCCAESVSIA
jgi:hypothetical protein